MLIINLNKIMRILDEFNKIPAKKTSKHLKNLKTMILGVKKYWSEKCLFYIFFKFLLIYEKKIQKMKQEKI